MQLSTSPSILLKQTVERRQDLYKVDTDGANCLLGPSRISGRNSPALRECILAILVDQRRIPVDALRSYESPTMSKATEEVDLLLHNARLRDELEPYIDESVSLVHFRQMNLHEENSFLESMLAWERAPALPIGCWSMPELILPRPDSLDDDVLSGLLTDTIDRLFSVRVVLEMTEHLSDRELYTLIYRDILPACEKKVDLPGNYLCWRCLDESDTDTWLAYYATEAERLQFLEHNEGPLPEPREVPFPRKLPRATEY